MSDSEALQTQTTGDGAPPAPQSIASSMIPRTLDQLESFAKTISQSKLCPKSYRGQPQDVTLAILYGMEVGLRPLQSLQSVAVINGRPAIYGDAALALVEQSGLAEYVKEWQEKTDDRGLTAYCEAKKKGKPGPTRQSFSWQEAQEAGLTNKGGPWQDYPRRMLQMRARSWALRDTFPEVLEGLYIAEEAEAIPADESETIDPGGMMSQSEDGAPNDTSGEVDVEYVQSRGVTVTKSQAEKIDQRDEALLEREGDELAAAILAVEEEMEDWPSDALCEACDAMLDEHRQRLETSEEAESEMTSQEEPSPKTSGSADQEGEPGSKVNLASYDSFPTGFPAASYLLDAGIETPAHLDQYLDSASPLTAIDGIGEARAEKIKASLEDLRKGNFEDDLPF